MVWEGGVSYTNGSGLGIKGEGSVGDVFINECVAFRLGNDALVNHGKYIRCMCLLCLFFSLILNHVGLLFVLVFVSSKSNGTATRCISYRSGISCSDVFRVVSPRIPTYFEPFVSRIRIRKPFVSRIPSHVCPKSRCAPHRMF